ncbi:DNA-directed RNA polymerase III subunit RPC11 [Pelomyxa schiedti]|nr:DNA-directed RNA polymerase III subunit RPC11 [Pelomyxa schiedti]
MFCGFCGNLLRIDATTSPLRNFCPTCSCVFMLPQGAKLSAALTLKRKKLDPIFTIANVEGNTSSCEITCERCGHREANCWEMQTRSADEPATIYYRCKKCAHQWNSN